MIRIKDKITLFNRISWILLVFSFLMLLISVTNGVVPHDQIFHTDGFYLATLFKNFFIDKAGLSVFKFPAAPFLFPDFFIFTFFQVIFQNYILSTVLTPISIFILIILSLIKISFFILEDKNVMGKSLAILLSSIFVLLISQNVLYLSTIYFITPVHHAGEMFIVCLALLILFKILKEEKTYLYPILFFIVFTTTLSDRTLMRDLTLPFISTYLAVLFLNKKLAKRLLTFTIIISASTFFGLILYRSAIFLPQALSRTTEYFQENISNLKIIGGEVAASKNLSFSGMGVNKTFANYLIFYIPLLLISIFFASVFIAKRLYKRFRTKKDIETNKYFLFFSIFTVTQAVLSVYSILFYSKFTSILDFRYMSLTFILPLFWLIYVVSINIRNLKIKHVYYLGYFSILIFVLLVTRQLALIKPGGIRNFITYKPANLECIETTAMEFGLKYGLGDYWNTASLNFYSQEGIEVNKISLQNNFILPHYWLNSPDPYINNKYSFLLTSDNITKESIISSLGKANTVVQCPTTEILIYKSDEFSQMINGRFNAFFSFAKLLEVGDYIEIEAKDLENYVSVKHKFGGEKTGNMVIDEKYLAPIEQSGYFLEGPIAMLLQGKYKITVIYKANGKNTGHFLIYTFPDEVTKNIKFFDTNNSFKPHSHSITIGGSVNNPSSFETSLYGQYRLGYFGFFPFYSGEGDLQIEKIIITREKHIKL